MTTTVGIVLSHIVGSPLYRVIPEHMPALITAALVPAAVWWLSRQARGGVSWAVELMDGYRRLPVTLKFTAWVLALSGAVHAGLVVGHPASGITLLYLLAAVVMVTIARRLVTGKAWRLRAAVVLATSIVAYAVTRWTGDPPDELGLATKLAELAALTVVLTPDPGRRIRRLAGSTVVVSLVLLTGVSAWGGAFIAARQGGGGHHGKVPMPGALIRHEEPRKPTAAERTAANRLFVNTRSALAKYRDTRVAAADGYQVEGIAGTDFHAGNPKYEKDGKILDPARPENLIYARTPGGRTVLLGAMFSMPSRDKPGPAIGGPLTQWHGHENICISFMPPAFSGLVSPFGGCPAGSIAFPITPEMMHVWIVPGAPARFGDIDENWRTKYLASLDA